MSTDSLKGSALKQAQWRQAAESQDPDRMCVTMGNIYAQYWKIKAIAALGQKVSERGL